MLKAGWAARELRRRTAVHPQNVVSEQLGPAELKTVVEPQLPGLRLAMILVRDFEAHVVSEESSRVLDLRSTSQCSFSG